MHAESLFGCIVGKMAQLGCRDGVNVLWCHSHLVWLVFEGSIPTCACFPLENFFVTCSCCLFGFVFREKRGGKGEDCTLYCIYSIYVVYNCVVHKEQRIIIN